VHAGVIEPGHFRFSVVGETIIDMKSRLYFTHKGTEKLFEGRTPAEGVELAERISGDTTVGHALAHCQAVEALADVEVPARAGCLTTQTARDHGVLGFVARASGLDIDARRDHPFAAYAELAFRVPVFESGDVKARTLARVEEAREAVGLIRQALERMPGGPLAV